MYRFPAAVADLYIHSWRWSGGPGWSALLELEFEHRLDDEVLKRAIELLFVAEPILACRLDVNTTPPCWEGSSVRPGVLALVSAESEVDEFRYADINVALGPQVLFCLANFGSGSRLLLRMSHEVGDGSACLGIMAKLAAIYTRLLEDGSYRPQSTTEYDRNGTSLIRSLNKRAFARLLLDVLRYYGQHSFPFKSHLVLLPKDSLSPPCFVVRFIEPAQVEFLARYGKERRASLNDVLLAAMARALSLNTDWDRRAAIRIGMTVDLRRGSQQRRTCCNLSSIEVLNLGRQVGRDYDETLVKVRAFSQARLRRHPGLLFFAVTHYFHRRDRFETILRNQRKLFSRSDKGQFPVLSNVGRLPTSLLTFGNEEPAAVLAFPAAGTPNLAIVTSIYNGRLMLSVGSTEHARPAVESFFDAILAELPVAAAFRPPEPLPEVDAPDRY